MGSYEQLNNIPDGFFHKLILHQNQGWIYIIIIYKLFFSNSVQIRITYGI